MKKIIILLHISLAFLFFSCKKNRVEQESLTLSLCFNSPIIDYCENVTVNENDNATLNGFSGYSSINVSGFPDSVNIIYSSILEDKSKNISVVVAISKNFSKSQLDSTQYGWVFKNESDFYSIFKKGSYEVFNNNTQKGISIILVNNSVIYSMYLPNGQVPSIAPYLDNSNNFQIENVFTKEIDWLSLSSSGILPNYFTRNVLLDINFKAKLFNNNNPSDSILLSNGNFKAFFSDRL